MTVTKVKLEAVAFDHDNLSDNAVRTLRRELRKFGLFLYTDPRCAGSSTDGYILSNIQLTANALRWCIARGEV